MHACMHRLQEDELQTFMEQQRKTALESKKVNGGAVCVWVGVGGAARHGRGPACLHGSFYRTSMSDCIVEGITVHYLTS